MANPILEKINQTMPRTPTNNNMLALLQNANNPQQLLNNMLTNNPQLMGLINKYGKGDPKAAFYELARVQGQDPQQILSMIQKFM